MTRLRWASRMLWGLAAIATLFVSLTGIAGGRPDSPEARLKARILDLQAEVALLDVECAAARENLLENLKKLGKLELRERAQVLQEIRREQIKALVTERVEGRDDALRLFQADIERRGDKEELERFKRFSEVFKSGRPELKFPEGIEQTEFLSRLQAARGESERMRADFLNKARSLHQKKLELAEAEAEYRATK